MKTITLTNEQYDSFLDDIKTIQKLSLYWVDVEKAQFMKSDLQIISGRALRLRIRTQKLNNTVRMVP
jgi:hypothetical protein